MNKNNKLSLPAIILMVNIVFLAFILNVNDIFASTCNTYGSTTYCSDGTTYNTYGNTTYVNGPNGYSGTANTYGNSTYYNGTGGDNWTANTYGNTTYFNGSNGTSGTANTYGNTTYSDGNVFNICPSNSSYDSLSTKCKCNTGYKVSGSSCIYDYSYTSYTPTYTSTYKPTSTNCPLNSYYLSGSCYCSAGYKINSDKTSCVIAPAKTDTQSCQETYGINSYSPTSGKCGCNSGYQWASDNKSCVVSPTKTNEQICQDSFGLNAIWDGTYSTVNGKLNCNCKTGFVWDSLNKTSCVSSVNTSSTLTLLFSTLKYGSSGNEVKNLQDKLKTKGYFTGISNGNFGPATKTAVKNFQAYNGLTADGVVGLKTREFLNK